MPIDVFISYSRIDTSHALRLAEFLRSHGFEVWMDRVGLEGASSWTKQIVQAIKECRTFIVLLSGHSMASLNVQREVMLATDKKKRILPIEIERVDLTEEFEYALAGIQRVLHTSEDQILRALGAQRTQTAAVATGGLPPLPSDPLGRTGIAVLPFEDFSGLEENEWFSEGLTEELISLISKLEKLCMKDRRAVAGYRHTTKSNTQIAAELGVDHVLQGAIRRTEDNLRISFQLINGHSGEIEWSNSFKGTMQDVFEIQEQIAREIAQVLSVHLSLQEQQVLSQRPTQSAEAHVLFLKASKMEREFTSDARKRAVSLLEECVAIDPSFAMAWGVMGYINAGIYDLYDRSPAILERARECGERACMLDPLVIQGYHALSYVYLVERKEEPAVENARKMTQIYPMSSLGYTQAGLIYFLHGKFAESIPWFEEALRKKPDDLHCHYNLAIAYHYLGNMDERRAAGIRSLPYFERHLYLNPADERIHDHFMSALFFAGELDRAEQEALKLLSRENVDAATAYNATCTFIHMEKYANAMFALERAVERGLSHVHLLESDPDLEPLRKQPQFAELLQRMRAGQPVAVV